MKKKEVESIYVLSEHENLFDVDVPYEIPLYQRPYAWEDDQIRDLIEDVNDVSLEEKKIRYCLGSLIVAKNGGCYEVIDGQQRLTTLYLLLNVLNIKTKKTLSFTCRDKSTKTLRDIESILTDSSKAFGDDTYQKEILSGLKIIKKYLPKDRDNFKEKLKHVMMYRIKVPDCTDLNHYFEIMNTRGEQLEQTDVLKGRLMSYLSKDDKRRNIFAKIWNACSDMTGYVQMHFTPNERNELFGNKWDNLPVESYQKGGYMSSFGAVDCSSEGLSIKRIIKEDFKIEKVDGLQEDDKEVHFESIIEFKHFLLHVLKVYIQVYLGCYESLLPKLIDEKKLIDNFEIVEEKGVLKGAKISSNQADFAFSFVVCLVRCRVVFDKYIIKREYVEDDALGSWSLKDLRVSGKKGKKKDERKPYYVNTLMKVNYEKKTTPFELRNKRCMMLQAALRVSYTSPKIMHWITDLLTWLIEDGYANIYENINRYEEKIESLIKDAVKKDFLSLSEKEIFHLGLATPHIVFNYLDYLLWKEAPKKYAKFNFEFRNSIEHWYPQNPSERTFDRWEHKDGLDQFGNLCLLPSNVNASFSNLDPQAKKNHWKEEVAKGSLKLRKMAEATVDPDNPDNASKKWMKENCEKHGAEMIKKLKNACGYND